MSIGIKVVHVFCCTLDESETLIKIHAQAEDFIHSRVI